MNSDLVNSEEPKPSDKIITDSDGIHIIKSFVNTFSLVRNQVESFNYFYSVLCPKIIQAYNPIEYKSNEGKYEISDILSESRLQGCQGF